MLTPPHSKFPILLAASGADPAELAINFGLRQMVLDEEENQLHAEFLKRYVDNTKQRAKAIRQRIAGTRRSSGRTRRKRAMDMTLPRLHEQLLHLEREFGQVVSLVRSKDGYTDAEFPSTTDDEDTYSYRLGIRHLRAVDQSIKESFIVDLQDNYEATIANLEAFHSCLPDHDLHMGNAHTVEQLQDHFDDVRTTLFPDTEYPRLTWTETACISKRERADSGVALSTEGSMSCEQPESSVMLWLEGIGDA